MDDLLLMFTPRYQLSLFESNPDDLLPMFVPKYQFPPFVSRFKEPINFADTFTITLKGVKPKLSSF